MYISNNSLLLYVLFFFFFFSGNDLGRAFRDLEWEAKIHEITQKMGIGAQFGGKYFCHDVRVVRLVAMETPVVAHVYIWVVGSMERGGDNS